MSVIKAFRFPVTLHRTESRIVEAEGRESPTLRIATPPEFPKGVAGIWSPEELLVASVASCYALTLAAIAEGAGVPLARLDVSGTGHVTRRDDRHFGFVVIELDATVETESEHLAEVRRAARLAEERCLVALALDVPVHVHADVTAAREAVPA